jgi:hypothetical protein
MPGDFWPAGAGKNYQPIGRENRPAYSRERAAKIRRCFCWWEGGVKTADRPALQTPGSYSAYTAAGFATGVGQPGDVADVAAPRPILTRTAGEFSETGGCPGGGCGLQGAVIIETASHLGRAAGSFQGGGGNGSRRRW